MKRLTPLAAFAAALVLASCVDDTSTPMDPAGEIPLDLLNPSLSVVDGDTGDGGNEHFFWLKPISKSAKSGKSNKFTGEADPNLFPTVVVCERVDQGGGVFDCDDAEPALATFERGSEPSASGKSKKSRKSGKSGKSAKGEIKVDNKDHYFVQWSLKDHAPERDGQYRIKVLLGGSELGHADVIVLRKSEKKAFRVDANDVLIPISDKGNFKIAFRLEVGVLESQFCDFDADGDVEDCDAAQEVAGDGKDTQIQVTDKDHGDEVVAVITAPDGVFTDEDGVPIPNVVVTAEVEILPPSDDVFTDDNQEIPYFVEVNTYPDNVFIDPNGPGVDVLVCQDEAVLTARGIVEPLHPQLILYKVGDNGVTRRLISTPAACAAPSPAPAQGFASLILRGVDGLRGLVGAQSLVARRRLHGGLNTKITRGKSLDDAFSTFGAVLGPNPDSTDAVFPANGIVGTAVPIAIQVGNALGENFLLGGDTLDVTVFKGPNTGAAVTVVDEGAGLYTASYTPTNFGTDSIAIVLIRNDGVGLGPIGGSPYGLTIIPLPDPAQSTATVSSSTVNQPVTVTLQVVDPAGTPVTAGGNTVAMSVTGGPNTGASMSVTDNDDGTYTGTYTPNNYGLDQVTITVAGVGVSGSPYTAPISSGPVQWASGSGGNDHWYQHIVVDPAAPPLWTEARTAAAALTHMGLPGHLVTFNGPAEQSFVFSALPPVNNTWMGLSDDDFDGVYTWVTGEDNFDLVNGCLGAFCNYTVNEPNNNGGIEWYGELWPTGEWNDLTDDGTGRIVGYFVEYEGPAFASVGTYSDVNGMVGTAIAFEPGTGNLTYTPPSSPPVGPFGPYQPAGTHPSRSLSWIFSPASSGIYSVVTGAGTRLLQVDNTFTLPLATIDNVTQTTPSSVTIDWTGDPTWHGSYLVRVWDGGIVGEQMVSAAALVGGSGSVTLTGLTLSGGNYLINVFAFGVDLTTNAPLPEQFNASASAGAVLQVGPPMLQPTDFCSDFSPAHIATFADANMDAAVRAELGLTPQDDLTCALVTGMTQFTPRAASISSAVGIQNLTSATWIDLRYNSITDLTPFSTLPSVTELTLAGNGITDMSPLGSVTSLVNLALFDNSISDISSITTLTNLQELNIWANQISDISPVASTPWLEDLYLDQNPISDISALASLTNPRLIVLGSSGTLIPDMSPLSGLTSLDILQVNDLALTDLDFMANLTGVSGVVARNNALTDISALGNMTELRTVWLPNNPGLSDVTALINSPAVGAPPFGTSVDLSGTAVSCIDVAALEAKGATVTSTCVPPANSWFATSSMATGGLDHAATLLNDGRVLVVGLGNASAQVYDPVSATFSTLPAPFSMGFGIAATKLADGRVLVSGGASGGGSLAAIFNPASHQFTAVGSLNVGRRYHAQALLPDGRVLVAGGFDGSTHFASIEIFDPGTSTFTLAPVSLSSGRVEPATALLPSGKLLLAGGSAPSACELGAELYDPVTNTLSAVPGSMTSCTHGGGLATLASGKVFLVGVGGTGQLYDPVTNSFSPTGALIERRGQVALALMADGRVMVTGGFSQISSQSLASVEIYDPGTGVFSAGPSMTQDRLDHTATLLLDGRILVTGGVALGTGILSSAEIYYP